MVDNEERKYIESILYKDLSEIDPYISKLIKFEKERQQRKIILIPSESFAPSSVLKALGSQFNNIYCEGYPSVKMTRDKIELLNDISHQLSYYRRYADRRFYKGIEYIDILESLAQRRIAKCFATDNKENSEIKISADQIFVNIQPLSGSIANNSVYEAFVEPGDIVMGMALPEGGHLTHGSEFNISGKRYNIISYKVNRVTEKLDYDEIKKLAIEYKPKMIIAGYSSYPWAPDWKKFREIADAVPGKAILFADIAHCAGLAIAGVYPNPIGYADVITFTTHKTICGPRGAVILTTDEDKANIIDTTVFPGEQGGPHANKFAAISVAFEIAQTPEFKKLQERIVENAKAFADELQKLGLKLSYNGTDTHLVVIDLNAIKTYTGLPLKGEVAARILDLCGIVTNKNTIPGDLTAADASGIRIGTPWITQRGIKREQIKKLAELIHKVLTNIHPYFYIGMLGQLPRGKMDLSKFEDIKRDVAKLVSEIETEEFEKSGYPHYWFLNENSKVKKTALLDEHKKLGAKLEEKNGWLIPSKYNDTKNEILASKNSAVLVDMSDYGLIRVIGERAKPFLQQLTTNDISKLKPGHSQRSFLLDKEAMVIDDVLIHQLEPDKFDRHTYILMTNPSNTDYVKTWLRNISDGYILFDDEIFKKVEGPVKVDDLKEIEDENLMGSKALIKDESLIKDKNLKIVAISLHGPNSKDVIKSIDQKLAEIKKFQFVKYIIDEIECLISRNGYKTTSNSSSSNNNKANDDCNGNDHIEDNNKEDLEEELHYDFYTYPNDAVKLWNLLLEKGKEFNVVPAGFKTREKLRQDNGFPIYEDLSRNDKKKKIIDGVSLYEISLKNNLNDLKNLFVLKQLYFVGQNKFKKYFHGKILDEKSFKDEQSYFISERESNKNIALNKKEFPLKSVEEEILKRQKENPKRTALYEEHRKLTNKIINFAGYEMPIWYTSISEEHKAVRETVGLFDVGHMGVIEISGENCINFLDIVTSNYIKWISDGQSQYTYLLDLDGKIIDDAIIYRRKKDKYMMIANAVNEDKDFEWLKAVNSKKYIIDRDNILKEIENSVIIRNLKDESSGNDQKIDIALQGPNSLELLQSLTTDEEKKRELKRIKRTEFIETNLAGIEMLLSRTGYTGEDTGYELYIHPDDSPKLWNLLLEKGKQFGIKPCGLATRDSTRIEAGLPLYGNDLAGRYNISPIEAGFGPYVKFHKPFFIGREKLLEREKSRKMDMIRFKMNRKGIKRVKNGDVVVSIIGQYIGNVTSCAPNAEGYQIGLAFVDKKFTQEGTEIGIFSLPHDKKFVKENQINKLKFEEEKPIIQLKLGEKVLIHEKAVVLPRFMVEKGKTERPLME
ncbi:MAG: glycine cleavage system aminomethyltransferase GcvT [Actinobacteria bacterium]|nr:glycine cleavage system aminomethyltransferase GcvT [Actinomycetota bacterium]